MNKFIKPCDDDMSRKVKKAFKLAHKTIHFEDFNDWLKEFIKKNSNKNSLRNNHQCTNREETKELQISMSGEEEKVVHEEDRNSLPSDSEKYKEGSHKYEEFYIEDNSETHSTLEIKQRESNDGCLNYEGIPTNGFSHLYVGDIEIKSENVAAIKISHENKYEYLVTENEEPISTSPSPLEL